jgi:uncharacterized protein YdeI (YjbR/CyaY-like superfamily)
MDPHSAPIYFSAPGEWRAWLARHGASATERWLGFYKVGSAQRGITYAQAVDDALCAG